jgi:hypothetical protein
MQKELKRRRRKRGLARDENIREYVQPFIDRLFELYEETDPSKGPASESDKLIQAQTAIHIWWRIYGKLLLWAQAQIVGDEIASYNPGLVDALNEFRGSQINENSHELELLGLGYSWNPPKHQAERVRALMEAVEGNGDDLDDEALRRVILRLLLSTDANSSFWRFPLQQAFRALNGGERDDLCEPAKARRRGRPYRLDRCRAIAISHVYYLCSQGMKKQIALRRVGEALAVSAETLRDWEKSLGVDDWFRREWVAASLAGEFEQEIKEKSLLALESKYGAQYNVGGSSDFGHAKFFLKMIEDTWSLKKLKADLKRLHLNGG